MPILLRCPACQKSTTLEDDAKGQRFRCPRCNKVLRVPRVIPSKLAGSPGFWRAFLWGCGLWAGNALMSTLLVVGAIILFVVAWHIKHP